MLRISSSLAALALLVFACPPEVGAAQAADARVATPKADAGPMVNLNTATIQEFETLPGIGAKTAERIIAYRQKNGPFKKIEELMNVQGIGEKSFLKLRARLTVASPKPER